MLSWIEETEDVFESSKARLTPSTMLGFACLQQRIKFHTDANQFVMTALLAQVEGGVNEANYSASKELFKLQTKKYTTHSDRTLHKIFPSLLSATGHYKTDWSSSFPMAT